MVFKLAPNARSKNTSFVSHRDSKFIFTFNAHSVSIAPPLQLHPARLHCVGIFSISTAKSEQCRLIACFDYTLNFFFSIKFHLYEIKNIYRRFPYYSKVTGKSVKSHVPKSSKVNYHRPSTGKKKA